MSEVRLNSLQADLGLSAPAWLATFARPPLEFCPVPFWSWNETMEPAEVRRQCRVIRDAGWGGAFLHARIGLNTDYLGEAWFEACAAALDECKKIGIKVWLYDEEGWPSGVSGGSVPLADEAFRQKVLFARPLGVPPPARSIPVGPPQEGIQIYRWTAPLGSWRFNGACYADLLDDHAMARFLTDAYSSYHDLFAADYGETIVAQFLDEPCAVVHVGTPAGALPFTNRLFAAFTTDHGYDVVPWLHLLFQDGPDAARVRVHYSRTVSRLFEENFSKRLGDWCGEHEIALTGHYMEGDLYEQQCLGNAIPQNYRHQQIPGIDHLCMQVSEVVTAKQCHSVVNQYAKPRMLCEAFGASGQNLSFGDRWWIGLHLLSLGGNLFNHHLSLFTMAGCRKRDFPPNLFFQQPWWPANHAVDEPLARLCVALAQGHCLAEALVIHPQESAAALLRVRADWPDPDALPGGSDIAAAADRDRIHRLDGDFTAVITALLGAQRVFDLGDETILRDVGAVETTPTGRPLLRVGCMCYSVVILPSLVTISASTFQLLAAFHRIGGVILAAGEIPTLVEGRASTELAALLAHCPRIRPEELSNVLTDPLVRLETAADVSQTFVQVRDLADGDRLVFLADRRRHGVPAAATLHLAGGYPSAHSLNPFTGVETPLAAASSIPLTLYPSGAHLFRLSRLPLAAKSAGLAAKPTRIVPLPDAAWHMERLDDNALTLDRATWRESTFESFTPHPIPVLAIQGRLETLCYSGPLTLRFTFRVASLAPGRKVHLVVEYAERYCITVNGTRIHPANLPPFLDDFRFVRIDITPLVTEGENLVEIHLTESAFSKSGQGQSNGTEIEAIYLVGDFHVAFRAAADGPETVSKAFPFSKYTNENLPPLRLSYAAADSLELVEPAALQMGDVVPQGLPFYAGRVRLSVTVPTALASAPWELRLSALDAMVAAVETDGRLAGHLFAAPLHLPIPVGTQRISVTLYSSLRNLLGPHHHESGEPVNTAPWFYVPFCAEGPLRADNTLAWAHRDFHSPNHRASYACVSFGETGLIEAATL